MEWGTDWASWIPWLNFSFFPTKCALSWRSMTLPSWIRSQGDFLHASLLTTYNVKTVWHVGHSTVRHLGLVCGSHRCREPADVPIPGCGSLSSRCLPACAVLHSCGSSLWNASKGRHRLSWQMLMLMIFLQMGESALNLHHDAWEGIAAPRISQPRVIWEMGAETALRKGQHLLTAPKNSIAGPA